MDEEEKKEPARPPLRPDTVRPRQKADPVYDRPKHPVDPAKIVVGDIMRAIIDRTDCVYGKVTKITASCDGLALEDLLEGGERRVIGWEAIAATSSADYYAETVKATRTTMSGIILDSVNRPITVAWVKKDGTQRVLRGFNTSNRVNRFGRAKCIDLDPTPEALVKLAKKHRTIAENFCEVDHRTLMYLIAGGVRFELKS